MMTQAPQATFHTRVRNEALGGPNPFEWKELTSDDIFKGARVVLFALPGAFTPTCSTSHLPRYEELYEEFKALGVDKVVCLSVNDAFVIFQWGKSQNADKVFLLPDGNISASECGPGVIPCTSSTARSKRCSSKTVSPTTLRAIPSRSRMQIPCLPISKPSKSA
jgi:peroxiredoxin